MATRPARGTREGTRERLVQAAIDLIRKGGIAAVSTVSVTQTAGFAQSSFYRHFASVDECLKAAAEQVGEGLRVFIAAGRREVHEREVQEREGDERRNQGHGTVPGRGKKEHFQSILNLFLQERQFAELMLRHRHDSSALGQVLGQVIEQIRTDLVADLWRLAQDMGIGEDNYDRVVLQSEFILASVLAAGESVLVGRVTDTDLVAEELCLLTEALYTATSLRYAQEAITCGDVAQLTQ